MQNGLWWVARPYPRSNLSALFTDNYIMTNTIVDRVLAELHKVLPEGLGQNVEKNLRAAMTGVFSRLDLVTREELEVQEAVLARTRERLADMEKRIAELEAKLK
jgi:BMFP domain-containing protein YqiC